MGYDCAARATDLGRLGSGVGLVKQQQQRQQQLAQARGVRVRGVTVRAVWVKGVRAVLEWGRAARTAAAAESRGDCAPYSAGAAGPGLGSVVKAGAGAGVGLDGRGMALQLRQRRGRRRGR